MALIYSPGPALIYCGVGNNNAPLYLGTTEGKPRLERRPHYVPVHNDLAGGTVEFDSMYVGQDAICHGRLSRYNMGVYLEMVKYAQTLGGPGVEGNDIAGDRGTLMIQEGAAYPIWFKFTRAFKASMNPGGGNNLIAGYRFLNAWLVAPDEMEPGVAPLTLSLTWHSLGEFSPSSQGGVFLLYDHDMAGLPNPD